jgi:glycosyltransferase involved in cell wall biosynthesis
MMGPVRILLWHGYLLGGTGSNVYTRSLARAWSELGHDVTVLCQDPRPDAHDVGSARVIRPDIGPVLPVFVRDSYEGFEVKLLGETSWAERQRVVEANSAAMRELLPVDYTLTNHVLLGAAVGVDFGEPFGVKVHGSELEFAIRHDAELQQWARVSLAGARDVIVGSEHVAQALLDTLGPGPHSRRVKEVPPGVDVELFRPRERGEALASLLEEARNDPVATGAASERLPDPNNAERFEAFFAEERPTVGYVGKLSREKGVHLLLEALERLDARAVVAGFGEERAALERQAEGLEVLFTGALEHRHLAPLWSLCDVGVVPSIFPEAFGMVAAEAAASGTPPLVACHSGLATVAEGLEAYYPDGARSLASFESGSVDDLARALEAILGLATEERLAIEASARAAAVERWGWQSIAAALIDGVPEHP